MTRFTIGALGAAVLLATPAATAATSTLDAQALKTTQAFLTTLATDIKDAVSGAEGGRARLLDRGRLRADLGREVDQLVRLTREAGGLASVQFNTFSLQATVWFGAVPVKEVELHMILTTDRLRLLRTVVRDTRMRVFGRPRAVHWRDDQAKSFGTLAAQMVRTMTDGGCDALPRIRPADHKALLPAKRKARKNTLAVFERFGAMIDKGCDTLAKVPHHATTWRFGELSGTVRTEGANPVPFKLTLTHDAQGAPKIFHVRGRPAPSR